MSIQKNYHTLNEEVESMRERFKEVKKKYVGSMTELRDIQMEHEKQKEDLLDTIRYQQSELKKYTSILNMLISKEQIQKIDRMSEWDDDKMECKIPYFYIRDKTVVYPKLNPQQAQEFINN